jgi:hypothetical protein
MCAFNFVYLYRSNETPAVRTRHYGGPEQTSRLESARKF